ncbi:MAG: hypothetical protein Q9223_005638 [Gallowayella weberi]
MADKSFKRSCVSRTVDGDHHDWRLPYIPDLNLLLTNRQLHAEAAPYFYGRNKFHLMLGIHPHTHCKVPAWDFVDDLASISKQHLRFMRSIELHVRAFDFSGDFHWHFRTRDFVLRDWNWSRCYAKSSYLGVKAGLDRFADAMRGEYRLHSLNVVIGGFIKGTAMQMKSLAVEKIPEYHGRRKMKSSRGTNKEQLYKLQPYVESRFKFCLEDRKAGTGNAAAEIVTTKPCLPYRLPWRVVLDYQLDSQGQARFTEAITPH